MTDDTRRTIPDEGQREDLQRALDLTMYHFCGTIRVAYGNGQSIPLTALRHLEQARIMHDDGLPYGEADRLAGERCGTGPEETVAYAARYQKWWERRASYQIAMRQTGAEFAEYYSESTRRHRTPSELLRVLDRVARPDPDLEYERLVAFAPCSPDELRAILRRR